MALPRRTTSDYDEHARDQLGLAVTRAREAAGWAKRADFAAHAGVSLRSLVKLENGEPGVGRKVLESVGRALPDWTEDTPRVILDGGPVPPTAEPTEVAGPTAGSNPEIRVTAATIQLVEEIRKELAERGITMTPDMLVAFLQGVDQQLGAERRQVESKTTERERSP